MEKQIRWVFNMKKWKYKKLEQISNERNIVDLSISDEIKNEYITELLHFLCYFKNGAGYEDSYTIFRALPRRKFCNDKTLSVEVNNISYDKNVYEMYGIDTFYFTINSFMKKYSNKKRIFRNKEVSFKEATNSLRNLRTINSIAFDIDFKDCNVLVERFNGDTEIIMDYIISTVNSILPVNAVVFSGNGFHLYYNINNEVIPQETKEKKEKILKYKSLCKKIANEFAKYDIICDSHVTGDVCRILRLPYTYNTKADNYKQSRIYYKNYREPYDIRYLLKKFNVKNNINIKDLISENNNSSSNNKKINNNNTIFSVINNGYTTPNADESLYTRNTKTKNYLQTVANRLEDIKNFVALKKEYEGRRNTLLSMTAIMLNDANEKEKSRNGDNAFIYDVEKEIDAINSYFSTPLDEKEVDKIKNNYNKYEYKTTNVYWSELLGLTAIDMTYSKEIINEEEAERRRKITEKRRNKKYYEKNKENISNKKKEIKQEKINNENALVAELINQGKNNAEIANELGCSVRKIQRIKSRINKN